MSTEQTWTIEKILHWQLEQRPARSGHWTVMYHVKQVRWWHGFDDQHNTWEPTESFTQGPPDIPETWIQHKLRTDPAIKYRPSELEADAVERNERAKKAKEVRAKRPKRQPAAARTSGSGDAVAAAGRGGTGKTARKAAKAVPAKRRSPQASSSNVADPPGNAVASGSGSHHAPQAPKESMEGLEMALDDDVFAEDEEEYYKEQSAPAPREETSQAATSGVAQVIVDKVAEDNDNDVHFAESESDEEEEPATQGAQPVPLGSSNNTTSNEPPSHPDPASPEPFHFAEDDEMDVDDAVAPAQPVPEPAVLPPLPSPPPAPTPSAPVSREKREVRFCDSSNETFNYVPLSPEPRERVVHRREPPPTPRPHGPVPAAAGFQLGTYRVPKNPSPSPRPSTSTTVLKALTISALAFQSNPTDAVALFTAATESRKLFVGHRDAFCWTSPAMVGQAGPFHAPPKGTIAYAQLPTNPALKATAAFHHLLSTRNLTLVAPIAETDEPYDGCSFPHPRDSFTYQEAKLRQFEESATPQMLRSDLASLQARAGYWGTRYRQVKRFLIVVTEEERSTAQDVPGVELVTLEEAASMF
ncbi:hypothetical protein RQP46_005915 [Phenoliferia psychrophenolica]